jgi:hypothetical protein
VRSTHTVTRCPALSGLDTGTTPLWTSVSAPIQRLRS